MHPVSLRRTFHVDFEVLVADDRRRRQFFADRPAKRHPAKGAARRIHVGLDVGDRTVDLDIKFTIGLERVVQAQQALQLGLGLGVATGLRVDVRVVVGAASRGWRGGIGRHGGGGGGGGRYR